MLTTASAVVMVCEREKNSPSKGFLLLKDRSTQGLFMLSAAETSVGRVGVFCGRAGRTGKVHYEQEQPFLNQLNS